MKINIHIIAYNEEIMLPFTIAHYKRMFGDPRIIVHDNYSTDRTVEIATEHGCTVIPFKTEGMNDTIQSEIKSTAAMSDSITQSCDWVLCIDADEECFINSADLDDLEARGINAVQFQGWNIFDEVETPWNVKIPKGVLDIGYAKPVLLRTGVFERIRFAAGAHSISLKAKEGQKTNFSISEYKLLHFKHWSCDWNIRRSAELGARQSKDNLAKRHSFHFSLPKSTHEGYFNDNFNRREIIIDKRIQYGEGITYMDLGPENGGEVIIVDTKHLDNVT